MKWNIEELKEKINDLEIKINNINDERKKYILLLDIYNLKQMVNYCTNQKNLVSNNLNFNLSYLDKNYIENTNEFFDEYVKNIILSLNNVFYINKLPMKENFSRGIEFSCYDKLLVNFLSNYNIEMCNLYIKYKNLNKIEFNKRKYFSSKTCLGICYNIFDDKQSYISVRYGKYIKKPTILLHELCHAYQFENVSNIVEAKNQSMSLLRESYPIFIEYIFLDYLKETRYRNLAYYEEGNKLDCFLCALEYGKENLLGNGKKTNEINRLIISHIIALYWLELYRTDYLSAKKEINYFNNNFGKLSIDQIFQEYNVSNITENVHSGLCRYLSNYNKK